MASHCGSLRCDSRFAAALPAAAKRLGGIMPPVTTRPRCGATLPRLGGRLWPQHEAPPSLVNQRIWDIMSEHRHCTVQCIQHRKRRVAATAAKLAAGERRGHRPGAGLTESNARMRFIVDISTARLACEHTVKGCEVCRKLEQPLSAPQTWQGSRRTRGSPASAKTESWPAVAPGATAERSAA